MTTIWIPAYALRHDDKILNRNRQLLLVQRKDDGR